MHKLAALDAVEGLLIRLDEPLSRHTPLRVGGPADAFVTVPDADRLRALLKVCRSQKIPWRVHWPFSDWIVREGGLRGVVIRPGTAFEQLEETDEGLRMGAATPWSALRSLGTGGWWHSLATWPGTPGSTAEAQELTCVGGLLRELRWMRGRGIESVHLQAGDPLPELPKNAVLIDLLLGPERNLSLTPTARPTGPGVFFTIPPEIVGPDADMGGLLARTGLVGTRLRRWRMSEVAPGTLVHLGGGTTQDLQLLTQGILARVERARGFKLNTRIPTYGRRPKQR
jgi:UDP-N-acetylenolpyruvoylglucosamine reductase